MPHSAPLTLEFRVARWLVERSPSEVELTLTTFEEPITSLIIELRSPAVETGMAERRMEQTIPPHTLARVERLGLRPAEHGHFPNASLRIIATTMRGQFVGRAELRSTIVVSAKPTGDLRIGDKAFFGVVCDGPLNLPVDPTFNQMLQHHFNEALWESLDIVWEAHPVARELKPGGIFAKRFTLIEPLGAGGMGAVWLATDSSLKGEHVALKFLPEELCHNPGAIDDLRDEVLKARKLAHDHIVRIYDLIEDEGTAAISMEYIDGLTLDAHRRTLTNKVFEVDDLLPLLPGLGSAIDYAHQRRIVHQDLKPMNLMLTREGVLKVMDFGLAGTLSETKTRLSRVHRGTAGTTPYMSPQQFESSVPGIANDIYSLGVTLYELLTRKPPFYGEPLQPQILGGQVQSIAERRAVFGIEGRPVPAAWEEVILQALSKVAAQRPKSASELCGRLIAGAKKAVQGFSPPNEATAAPAAPLSPRAPPVRSEFPQNETSPPAEPHRLKPMTAFAPRQRKPVAMKLIIAVLGCLGAYAWWAHNSAEAERLGQHNAELAQQAKRHAEQNAKPKAEPTLPPVQPQPPPEREAVKEPNLIERVTTKGNSLGMKFIPFTDTTEGKVLGCEHETRTKDYTAFMASGDYKMEGDHADDWKSYTDKTTGLPVGRGKEGVKTSTHPVCNVSYIDAQAFCAWLTKRERAIGLLGPKDVYRLPTDAEWSLMVGLGKETGSTPSEKSANGPNNVYPWGSTYPPTSKDGNYDGDLDGFATTAPVKSFPPNKLGFYDLGGNAWEWCEDWYDGDGGDKKYRVLRGGSWYGDGREYLLSSDRFYYSPVNRYDYGGFRCVLVVGGGSPKSD